MTIMVFFLLGTVTASIAAFSAVGYVGIMFVVGIALMFGAILEKLGGELA